MIRPSRARFLIAEQPEPLVLSLPQPEANAFELYVPSRYTTPDPSCRRESNSSARRSCRLASSSPTLIL